LPADERVISWSESGPKSSFVRMAVDRFSGGAFSFVPHDEFRYFRSCSRRPVGSI
jgi:hypothetical protein